MKVILAILLLLVVGTPAYYLLTATGTELTVNPAVKYVGYETPLVIHEVNPHGVRKLNVRVEQGNVVSNVDITNTARRFRPERNLPPKDVTVVIGRKPMPGLHDGKIHVTITAVSNDFLAKTASIGFDAEVFTAPPRVSADGVQHYINQGGAEMVTFTPGGAWTDAGVMVGDRKFRSFPLPNHPGQYFSLFAMFWNTPVDTPMTVYATNPSGAMAKAGFWFKVFPKKFRASTIRLEDMGLERIVNQIDPENKIPGTLVERFVKINSEMRKQNNQTLADLRFQTEQKFLWDGAFLPMVDSTVESRFADDRTYTWQGKKVDEQTHLGFDLAKLSHSPIPAANDGKVLLAEPLGIYGNCVVIDHGFGLQTIYGHLSEFLVKKGDMVKKAQIIGKTGSTGLAGGDHLHFTMQIDGVQVNAVEWWDAHWIKDRILSKINGDTPTPAAAPEPVMSKPAKHSKKRRR